jgi:hypothetical protein
MDQQSNNQPWQEKGVSPRTRYLSKLGLIFVASLLVFPVGGIFVGLSYWLDSPADFWKEGFPVFLISTILSVVGIIVLRKSIIMMRSPISFIPSHKPIPPQDLGRPIEVWYEKFLDGFGTIQFDNSAVILKGNLPRTQGGIIVSLISLFQRREESDGQIPYDDIKELVVKRRCLGFNHEYLITHYQQSLIVRAPIRLYFSESDGERMYRELKRHFPSAVSEHIL